MSKTKPILFNTEMVRAILEGHKTQTRRLVTPQPPDEFYFRTMGPKFGGGHYLWSMDDENFKSIPKYQPDDILWVRETFACVPGGGGAIYRATWRKDGWEKRPDARWTPSIHMPKWACRTWLRVTGVRAERLQDISEADAKAEGVAPHCGYTVENCTLDYCRCELECHEPKSYRAGFVQIWDSLPKEGFEFTDSPWVWVYEFEPCDKPEGWDNE